MGFKGIYKILLISTEFPPGPGGIGNHAWNLARNLNNAVQVDVLTVSDYADMDSCKDFDKIEKINIYRFRRLGFPLITYLHRAFKIIKEVRNNNYTHCILSGHFALSMCLMIKLVNNKIIRTAVFHGSELLQRNLLLTYLLKRNLKSLNILISVSKYTNNLIPIKIDANQKNVIIPNGVNINLLDMKDKSNSTIKISGNPCLLSVGSITHRKGQINLINALPIIKKKYPDVHYHCVGLPIDKDKIMKRIKSLNLESYMTLHGVIDNNQLNNIYKQADILIMLSQSNIDSCVEGFGIVILEANLFGVPALGSKQTGIEDAIVQKKTGVLVDPYSNEEILSGIDLLLGQKKYLSQNAVVWALEHNWSQISDRYLKAIINE